MDVVPFLANVLSGMALREAWMCLGGSGVVEPLGVWRPGKCDYHQSRVNVRPFARRPAVFDPSSRPQVLRVVNTENSTEYMQQIGTTRTGRA